MRNEIKDEVAYPVLRRIGFGAWHATCSALGSEMNDVRKFQNGLPVLHVRCRRGNKMRK
jgi:hypothetical protein